MFLKLFLFFTAVPLIELYILIKIGSFLGFFKTMLIVIGTGILGAYLAKREGFKVVAKIRYELGKGNFPGDEMIEGLVLFIAGMLLITPGVLTDMTGIILLLPIIRNFIVLWIKEKLYRMMQRGDVSFSGFIR